MAKNLREYQIIAEGGAHRSELWHEVHAKRWDGGDPTLDSGCTACDLRHPNVWRSRMSDSCRWKLEGHLECDEH